MKELINYTSPEFKSSQTMRKVMHASLLYFFCLTAARVAGATNDLPNMDLNADPQAGIIYAMFRQILNNPSSAIFIPALCVIGWLVDDLPFINSRYAVHIMVILGAFTFRFFCLESAVPQYFPHPQAVFFVNGIIAGFIAWAIHRQLVSRIINAVRFNSENRRNLKPFDNKPDKPFSGSMPNPPNL